MKRLNPETGKPFKRGDVGEGEKRFHGYNLKFTRKDGQLPIRICMSILVRMHSTIVTIW